MLPRNVHLNIPCTAHDSLSTRLLLPHTLRDLSIWQEKPRPSADADRTGGLNHAIRDPGSTNRFCLAIGHRVSCCVPAPKSITIPKRKLPMGWHQLWLKIRDPCLDCIDLGTEDPVVCNVREHVAVRTNLSAKQPNRILHAPLGATRKWSTTQGFLGKMGQQVDRLLNKLEAVDLSLIIELFKFDDVLAKGEIGFFEAGNGDRVLVDRSDAKNEFAKVPVVLVGEDTIEDTGPEDVDVQKEFPGFVTT